MWLWESLTLEGRSADQVWFTADTHFGHENIIDYCRRPFATAGEMDLTLIAEWNDLVKPGDLVFHLGDFTLGGRQQAANYFSLLNGEIRVVDIPWHHDKRWLSPPGSTKWQRPESANRIRISFLSPMALLEIERPGEQWPLSIHLSHYPVKEWERRFHGGWHLHGHTHGRLQLDGLAMDVGVDANGYKPVSLKGVCEFMSMRAEAI